MSGFTRGPLVAHDPDGGGLFDVYVAGKPTVLTACYCTAGDATLYAAAPDLFEALRPFAEAAAHLHPSQPDDATTLDGIEVRHWRAAFAAIAKAKGEGQ